MALSRRALAGSVGLVAVVLAIAQPAHAAFGRPASPYGRFTLDLMGDVIAGGAIASHNPYLAVIGVSYKAVDWVHDVGDAAIDKKNSWLDTQLILTGIDARELKAMASSGADLNGPQARAVKQRLRERSEQIGYDNNAPLGYTASAIVRNIPYGVSKVTLDELCESSLGWLFKGISKIPGVSKLMGWLNPVPRAVKWGFNWDGPLRNLQRRQGWTKLGTRATRLAEAVREAMHDQEMQAAAKELSDRFGGITEDAVAEALADMYDETMREHPSAPRQIIAANFRARIAVSPVLMPAPAAPIPAMMAAPEPVMRASPDPVIRAIGTDDGLARRYSNPVSGNNRTASGQDSSPQPPAQETPVPAWQVELHEGLKRVGDGKTFDVCSNGCPPSSGGSFDGRNNTTLTTESH